MEAGALAGGHLVLGADGRVELLEREGHRGDVHRGDVREHREVLEERLPPVPLRGEKLRVHSTT